MDRYTPLTQIIYKLICLFVKFTNFPSTLFFFISPLFRKANRTDDNQQFATNSIQSNNNWVTKCTFNTESVQAWFNQFNLTNTNQKQIQIQTQIQIQQYKNRNTIQSNNNWVSKCTFNSESVWAKPIKQTWGIVVFPLTWISVKS